MTHAHLSIAATFTAEPLVPALEICLRRFELSASLQFAPFNQVIQSLVDPRSRLIRNAEGLNVILVRLTDWVNLAAESDFDQNLNLVLQEFSQSLTAFSASHPSPTLVLFCPSDFPEQTPQHNSFQRAEQEFANRFQLNPSVTVVTSQEQQRLYPCAAPFDPIADRTAHVPYTDLFYAGLGTRIARHLYGLQKRPTKVIVLDCDNTLWNGVCGEVGSSGIVVEPEQQEFQRQLLRFRERGQLLALCSKNSEADVWSVFEQQPNMVLRRDHFSAAAISWHDKSSGLQSIADQLRVGLDSLLFLDDNPLEIAEVRTNAPAVTALQLPPLSQISDFMNHLWPLDQVSLTRDDQIRAGTYQQETQRQAERGRHLSMRSFIENLNLRISFLDIDETNLSRAAQLIERTNQFNVTLKRRSVVELRQALTQNNMSAFLVDVADKYGEYGIVGLAICQVHETGLAVDTLALSCRALGRGVEYHILKQIGLLAQRNHLVEVWLQFVPGERNEPAANFLTLLQTQLPKSETQPLQYRFKTESLLQINPLDLIDAESGSQSEVQEPVRFQSAAVASRSEAIQRIATEFNSVDSILRCLEQSAVPRPELKDPFLSPTTELEQQIAQICAKVLRVQRVGVEDPLTQLGASSLQLVQIHSRLVQQLQADLAITELYTLPNVAAIAQRLGGCVSKEQEQETDSARICQATSSQQKAETSSPSEPRPDDIAIIGMAGRFPGADSVAELWENLIQRVNSIVPLSDEELNLPADSPLRSNPNLVRKSSAIRNADQFDAKFFGIFPKEAKVMDPQHRLLLESCWTALEDAGYCPDRVEQSVGVFAGCYMDTYILASLQSNPEMLMSLANSFHGGDLHTELGNDKDYLATRISFLLNLRGPAMTIQTACSTSLVAIIQACQAIQNGHCEMALAGGATLKFPQHRGYLYTEGGMVSPDGICRPFDADARGTVFGEGVGVVVLKKLDQAISDGDEIYGVIRGWGINNDGRSKMAYTAPSVNGQSSAIEMAHRHAQISADSISYVEAHGTGTSLGDPIEVDSLTKAFRKTTDKQQFCAIGSIKSNIGHLDVAAGVTGLIKICLSLRHQKIAPSINYLKPNPNIDFANGPFYVVTQAQAWPVIEGQPRRAGLSSFGVGGTNAHLVIQEPPQSVPLGLGGSPTESGTQTDQLLLLSARSAEALDALTLELGRSLVETPDANLANVAYTLQMGRKEFVHKRILVAASASEASQMLLQHTTQPTSVFSQHQARRRQSLDFVFPGQGSQHLNMAVGLYQHDRSFRSYFDQCVQLLIPHLGFDLREKIFAAESESTAAEINQTGIAQPAIFSLSYSLAKRLEQVGIKPQRMVGHSVGEFVAACLAGVFSLEDALRLIAFRAQHMQAVPAGTMAAVRIKEDQLRPMLAGTQVEIAAINSPDLCVISGPTQAVIDFQVRLEQSDFVCRPLHTSHAFHSQMMDGVIEPFAKLFAEIKLQKNEIPIISSVTGKLLTEQQALDPLYWSRHLRETVRFADAIGELLDSSENGVLEVGPGQALSTLIRQHPTCSGERTVLSVQPHAKMSTSSVRHWLLTLGRLWQAGVAVQWNGIHNNSKRGRTHLPTYPFERQRYWFDEIADNSMALAEPSSLENGVDVESTIGVDSIPTPLTQSKAGIEPAPQGVVVQAAVSLSPMTNPANPAQGTVAEQVIRQQLQLMQQQLELWRR